MASLARGTERLGGKGPGQNTDARVELCHDYLSKE